MGLSKIAEEKEVLLQMSQETFNVKNFQFTTLKKLLKKKKKHGSIL